MPINKPANFLDGLKNMSVTPEQFQEILSACYGKAIQGIPGTKTCTDLAGEYLNRYSDSKIAARKFINNQITKCTTSGFITSLGGLITLPVAIPANIASVVYVQMRMIVTLAAMSGMDPSSDEVQTLTYICLVNASVTNVVKSAGIQVTNKLTLSALKKIPGSLLSRINRYVGFRLLTKFGTTGIINLGKMVPVVGGVVGGGFDLVTTKIIADRAYKMFVLSEID